MNTIRSLAGAIALLFVFAGLPTWGQALTDEAIRSLLRDRLDPKADVGMVVALISPKGVRYVTAGAAGPGGLPVLDEHTVFEIGSVTKVFTAAVLAGMWERGEVAPTTPVKSLLPAEVRVPERDGRAITLLDLTTHTSGLPTLPANLVPADNPTNPYSRYSVPQLYDFLGSHQLTREIGSRFEYSNVGVGLLGHALALKAGVGYEEMVRGQILAPLAMKDTAITLTPAMKERLAIGHDGAGNPVPGWDLPTLAGAGALRSTARDMARFVQANLAADDSPLPAALKRSHKPQRPVGGNTEIALGWLVTRSPGGEIVWHNGQTGGYHSFVGLVPKQKTGVVVLHNSASDIDDIGFYLLDNQLPPPAKRRAEVSLKPEWLALLAGEYQLVPGFVLTVTLEGGKLFVQATGQPRFQVFPGGETEFFYKDVDAQITFVKDAAGKVSGLVLHQNGRDLEGKRIR